MLRVQRYEKMEIGGRKSESGVPRAISGQQSAFTEIGNRFHPALSESEGHWRKLEIRHSDIGYILPRQKSPVDFTVILP
ncbi:MAG: hypothetical protein IPL23_17360 [Saprospiraceae bacterium]|nr:hypothetical protein [Saprospiraceae bacterium]